MKSGRVYDVAIVGGGPAGCATALSLIRSRADATFLLVDDADSSSFKIGESLPADAGRVLEYLAPELPASLDKDVEIGLHKYCTGNASAWGSTDMHGTDSLLNPFGMGLHLDRAAFDELLRDTTLRVASKSVSEVIHGKCVSAVQDGTNWVITIEDTVSGARMSYRSDWLVDATGRKASIARKLGARTVKDDSLLSFFVVFTNVLDGEDNPDDDHRTLIEATESGWFYTSQLSHNRRVVAYHTDDRDTTSKTARKLDGFLELMHTRTTHISSIIRSGHYDVLNEPGVAYPGCTAAGSSYLQPPCGPNWCAVGDAAMAFDPLSSQGIITALKMGSHLGLELSKSLAAEGDSHAELRSQAATPPFQVIIDVFGRVRADYDSKKAYYYGLVRRFDTEFWKRRRGEE